MAKMDGMKKKKEKKKQEREREKKKRIGIHEVEEANAYI